jgi:2C-methyl-D-erythritol 2,4-cyclodiphosphate synthase
VRTPIDDDSKISLESMDSEADLEEVLSKYRKMKARITNVQKKLLIEILQQQKFKNQTQAQLSEVTLLIEDLHRKQNQLLNQFADQSPIRKR